MPGIEELLKKQAEKKKAKKAEAIEKIDEAEASPESKSEIASLIESNKIIMFTKSYCPFCRQAKMALGSIPNLEYKVIDLDVDGDHHEGWQRHIAEIGKAKAVPEAANNNPLTVPQIFIDQNFMGGADDLADMMADGRLATMLGRKLY
jgi:glutaredoxin 3